MKEKEKVYTVFEVAKRFNDIFYSCFYGEVATTKQIIIEGSDINIKAKFQRNIKIKNFISPTTSYIKTGITYNFRYVKSYFMIDISFLIKKINVNDFEKDLFLIKENLIKEFENIKKYGKYYI